jgi:phosphatidylglycerol:prolipoprotein diacylglycerol transferase
MHPRIISLGNFFLPSYGLLVALAFLIGLAITTKLARRGGLDAEAVTNLGIYGAISGIVGAKLLMFAADLPYYVSRPGEIFSLSTLQAGGIFYGGFVAAVVFAFFYMRKKRLPMLPTLDAFAPGLAIGHAIGRLGCFAAGCCWGKECHRAWAVTFTDAEARRLVGVPLNVPLHPTQLYEALAEAATFAFLYRVYTRPHPRGSVIGLYLMLYPAVRFTVEFFRHADQPNPFGGPLTSAQWTSLGLCAAGAWLVVSAFRGRNKAA